MHTVGIIQARMGSTRFPGKMLAKLGEFSCFEWVVTRLNQAKTLDSVILATTTLPADDVLVNLAVKMGMSVYRGDELDVLGRFVGASIFGGADNVVRICADNPFIDPIEVDRLVCFFNETSCDYACNHQNRLNSGYADGFGAEILSTTTLNKINILAKDAGYREHVTMYLWDHLEEFDVKAVKAPGMLNFPELRFDLDTEKDLHRLRFLVDVGVTTNSSAEKIIYLSRLHSN